MRLEEVTKADSFFTFQTKKRQICENLTRQRGLGLAAVNQ